MVLGKLSRDTLTDQAIKSLTVYIRENDLKPGDMLPAETVLTSQFGVSRPVIREALKALEGRNVIEIINGRGAVIKALDSKDLHEFFDRAYHFDEKTILELLDVRQGLEVQAARIAARLHTSDEAAELTEIVHRMRTQFGEEVSYSESDLAFHLTLAAATHNAMMYHLIDSIRQYTRDTMIQWHTAKRTEKDYERIQRLHEAILDAILARDAEGAGVLMTRHFEDAIFDVNQRVQGSTGKTESSKELSGTVEQQR
jgi:GntR family transcriptional repressor for pyruvate dehydrogenase complex